MRSIIVSAISAIFIIGCSTDPREKAIKDYVETIGNVKTDLNFKVIKIAEVSTVTSKDSLDYHVGWYGGFEDYKRSTSSVEDFIVKHDKERRTVHNDLIKKSQLRIDSLSSANKKSRVYLYGYDLSRMESTLREWQGRLEDDSLDLIEVRAQVNKYGGDPNVVLRRLVECTYKIKNPLLNNVEQEITRKFYLSPDGNRVLASLDK